jgi:hypothetical protein
MGALELALSEDRTLRHGHAHEHIEHAKVFRGDKEAAHHKAEERRRHGLGKGLVIACDEWTRAGRCMGGPTPPRGRWCSGHADAQQDKEATEQEREKEQDARDAEFCRDFDKRVVGDRPFDSAAILRISPSNVGELAFRLGKGFDAHTRERMRHHVANPAHPDRFPAHLLRHVIVILEVADAPNELPIVWRREHDERNDASNDGPHPKANGDRPIKEEDEEQNSRET